MKRLLIVCGSLIVATTNSQATSPTLELITQPLYWLASANHDKGIRYAKVPRIMNHTYPPLMVHFYHSPTFAPDSKSDLNLISRYGVKIVVTKASVKGSPRELRVDLSEAKQPARFRLTIQEVGTYAARAIRADFKDPTKTKIFIFDGEKSVPFLEPRIESTDAAKK